MSPHLILSFEQQVRVYMAAALAHLRKGRLNEARRTLETARALNPHQAQVHYLLAKVTAETGDHATALSHLMDAWERDHSLPEPYALAGRLLHLAGHSPLGARLLEHALALAPEDEAGRTWLRELQAAPRAETDSPEFEGLIEAWEAVLSHPDIVMKADGRVKET